MVDWIRPKEEVRIGSEDGYMSVTRGGVITFVGKSAYWDDFSVPFTLDKQGQSSKPDYDYDELGLLFPQNDATEIAHFTAQMQHRKKLVSGLRLHIHYIQDEAEVPTFKIDYRWYNNGSTVPESWTTISTGDGSGAIFAYSSGSILQILPFAEISAPIGESVSSNLDVKFYRDDNTVTGDVLGKYIDFHFVSDTLGSYEEYSKD